MKAVERMVHTGAITTIAHKRGHTGAIVAITLAVAVILAILYFT
jgi:hypothetical protein